VAQAAVCLTFTFTSITCGVIGDGLPPVRFSCWLRPDGEARHLSPDTLLSLDTLLSPDALLSIAREAFIVGQ